MIDIGLNLASQQFDKDREQVIKHALDNGVAGFILTGTSKKSSQEVFDLASKYPDIMRCTSGVHPHDAKNWEKSKHLVEKLCAEDLIVAVGECGLDYDRMFSTVEEQQHAFEEQLKLAVKYNKPVFLHVRGAIGKEKEVFQDFIKIFKPYHEKGVQGVVHCFTGSGRSLNSILNMGLYVGITGWVNDDDRGKSLQELIKYIPNDRLMIETDAPYLTPKNMPKSLYNKRNEPAFLNYVLDKVSELKKIDKNVLNEQMNKNVETLFKWKPV